MRFIEALASKGVLRREFDMWHIIREKEEGCDWIDPDPSMQMTFAVASDTQKANARRDLEETIQAVCNILRLIHDKPQVEPGLPIPPAPNGQRYYGDWYNGIRTAVITANSARPK